MKKGILRSTAIMMALLIAFGTAISAPATVNNNNNDKSASELKFIGNIENQPVFQLNLNNTEEDEYTISISDKYGNLLYSDRIKGTNITKRFRLNTEEIGDETLNVKIKSRKTGKPELFEIRRSSRLVEEASVSKI